MAKQSVIKMDFGMMDETIRSFQNGSEQLDEVLGKLNKIVGMIENGGLVGAAGTAYVESVRSNLIPTVKRMQEKFAELQNDLRGAVDDMRSADADASGYYS